MPDKKGLGKAAIISTLLISGAGYLYKQFKKQNKRDVDSVKDEYVNDWNNDSYWEKKSDKTKNTYEKEVKTNSEEILSRNDSKKEYIPLLEIKFRGPGSYWKNNLGIGYTEAAKVISGVSHCEAALGMKIRYSFGYRKFSEQKIHDEEIKVMSDLCKKEWDDLEKEIIDDWNDPWEPIEGLKVAIYGKPDLKIFRKGGGIIIGDAKTGKKFDWHQIQNKLALYALIQENNYSNKKNAVVLKYSNEDNLRINKFDKDEEIISPQDLEKLREKIAKAMVPEPKFIPSEECKYCKCLEGCNEGTKYKKTYLD